MRRPLVVLAVALAVRLAAMVALGLPRDVAPEESWSWAYEQGAVAAALLRGEGYADAFAQGTGPTAWCGAVYPAFLALVLELTGGLGRAAAIAVALVHALLSAAIAALLLRLGEALERPRVGALAGWAWALHPGAVYYPLVLVWDSVFVAFGLTWVLVSLARAGPAAAARALALRGLGYGALLLVNPAPLAILPALLLFVLRGRSAGALRAVLAFCVPAALVLLPWSARNLLVLGTPQLKANLGVELWVGNAEGADGGFRPHVHPAYNRDELELYRELGEAAYSRDCAARFRARAAGEPGEFVRLSVLRARSFWLGVSPFEDVPLRSGETRQRDWQGWIEWFVHLFVGVLALSGAVLYRDPRGGAVLLRGVVLLFPLVYYATHVLERYRFPIEPVVTYLAAATALALVDRLRKQKRPAT